GKVAVSVGSSTIAAAVGSGAGVAVDELPTIWRILAGIKFGCAITSTTPNNIRTAVPNTKMVSTLNRLMPQPCREERRLDRDMGGAFGLLVIGYWLFKRVLITYNL